jgi:hypothetical protein
MYKREIRRSSVGCAILLAGCFLLLAPVGVAVQAHGVSAASSSGRRPSHKLAPTVASVKRFRLQKGLDLDLGGDEAAVDARAKKLVAFWRAEDAFAVRTARQWGSPLRHVDLRELKFRKRYVKQALLVIPAWAVSNAPSAYAGLCVDERGGGLIEVGFNHEQSAQVEKLQSELNVLAPSRIEPLPFEPRYALAELEGLEANISSRAWSVGEAESISLMLINVPENKVRIYTQYVQKLRELTHETYGFDAPIAVMSSRKIRITPR